MRSLNTLVSGPRGRRDAPGRRNTSPGCSWYTNRRGGDESQEARFRASSSNLSLAPTPSRALTASANEFDCSLTGEISLRDRFSCVVLGVEWGVLVDSDRRPRWRRRPVPWSLLDTDARGLVVERSLTKAFGSLLSHVATLATREGLLCTSAASDELVAQVAEKLMPASATNRQEVLDWVFRSSLNSSMRTSPSCDENEPRARTHHPRAQWPPRDDVPDPDPLGRSPSTRPIFMAMRDLALRFNGHRRHERRTMRRTMEGGASHRPPVRPLPLPAG